MDRYAPIVKQAIDRKMRDEGKIVTGKTAKGVNVKSFEHKQKVGLRASSTKRFSVMNTGRGPNQTPPPYTPIMQWIKRKNIAPKKTLKSAAIAISKSIGKRGFPGVDIWGMALDSVLDRLLNDTSEAYIKDIEQHLKKSSEYAGD